MIFEIRNYHFDPAKFTAYKEWGEREAIPYLARELDLVGFWVSTGDAPEVIGRPHDDLGPANVTWTIRWRNLDERNEVLPRLVHLALDRGLIATATPRSQRPGNRRRRRGLPGCDERA